jgi:hypothetical protein
MHLNGLEKVVSQANFPELVIMKIEPPAVIIGGEYKEGAVVNFKWTNLFKRNKNVNDNSLLEEKEIK